MVIGIKGSWSTGRPSRCANTLSRLVILQAPVSNQALAVPLLASSHPFAVPDPTVRPVGWEGENKVCLELFQTGFSMAGISFRRRSSAVIKSGLVPQQPPRKLAPAAI